MICLSRKYTISVKLINEKPAIMPNMPPKLPVIRNGFHLHRSNNEYFNGFTSLY